MECHFKRIIPILLFSILSGQFNSIKVENDSLYFDNIETIEDTLIKILYGEDSFGDSFELNSIDSFINYSRKRNSIYIDTLYTIDKSLRPKVFLRMFESIIRTSPTNESNEQFKGIINSNPAFTDSSNISYGLTKGNRVGAVINLKNFPGRQIRLCLATGSGRLMENSFMMSALSLRPFAIM